MDFLTYFFACFTPIKVMLMVGGAIGGILMGAAPGLSPTMAVALLVPFTFHMQPADGLILLDAWHDRVEYPEMRRKVAALIKLHDPDTILVEKAASGQSLIQELRRAGIAVAEFRADRDKVARAHSASNVLESGAVWVPVVGRVNGGENREIMPFAQMVVDECSTFPSGAHDDLVDTTVQALLRFRQSGMLRLGSDDWGEPVVTMPRSPNYSPYS